FGVTGLINFAHGELVTFGAAAAWYLNTAGLDFRLIGLDVDGPALTLGLAALVALAFSGVLGAGLERGLFLPLRRRRLGAFQFVVLTIGLSLLGRQLLQLWIGERRLSFRDYAFQKEWDIGPIGLTPRDATIMGIALVVLLAVAAMLQKTRTGKAMRAV